MRILAFGVGMPRPYTRVSREAVFGSVVFACGSGYATATRKNDRITPPLTLWRWLRHATLALPKWRGVATATTASQPSPRPNASVRAGRALPGNVVLVF